MKMEQAECSETPAYNIQTPGNYPEEIIQHSCILFIIIIGGILVLYIYIYRGADKSLARPGRKQATATEDFDVHISYL